MCTRASFLPFALGCLLGGCVDADPVSPDFEQRLFSLLGGLEVGEALTLNGETAESIVLDGGEGGAEYLFVPFLAAEEGAVRLRLRVSGEEIESPPGSSRALTPAPAGSPAAAELFADRSHVQRLHWERQAAGAYLRQGGASLRASRAVAPAPQPRSARVAAVGDIVDLRVINQSPANLDLCSNPHLRRGRVTAVTENAILVEDLLNPIPLSVEDVQRIAGEYEQLVHPVAVENFGEPTDIDGNGRVYIFMTSALNEAAARADGGITVGFTFALDLIPRAGVGGIPGCEASNQGEIFYLIAPDPQGRIGVTVPEVLVRRLTTTIIVHELQHMINSGRRLYEVRDARELEELWLNEGLSHIAEELVFYRATGLRPRSDLGWAVVSGDPEIFDAYSRFLRDNITIYADYLASPDAESLMGRSAGDDSFATRGATWAFLRYLADHIATDDAALFHALVNSPVAGLSNLERVTEGDPLRWMQRWTVSNYADNLPGLHVDERFTQPSWNYRSMHEGELGYRPLSPLWLRPDEPTSLTLHGGGSSYLRLRAAPGRKARLNSTRTGDAIFGELRASVLRIE